MEGVEVQSAFYTSVNIAASTVGAQEHLHWPRRDIFRAGIPAGLLPACLGLQGKISLWKLNMSDETLNAASAGLWIFTLPWTCAQGKPRHSSGGYPPVKTRAPDSVNNPAMN